MQPSGFPDPGADQPSADDGGQHADPPDDPPSPVPEPTGAGPDTGG